MTVDVPETRRRVWRALGGADAQGPHARSLAQAWCLCCTPEVDQGYPGKGMLSLSGGPRPVKHEVMDRPRVTPCPPVPPRCPSSHWVQGLQIHTTAVFASTPLLLWDELMGYSATLVPFSSFLSGFLEREGGNKDIVRGSNCDGATSESESRLAACGVNQKPSRVLARMTI